MFSKNINIFVLLFILFLLGCSENKEEQKIVQKETPKTNVKIYNIQMEKIPIWLHFYGKTKAYADITVTARVKGNLEKIFFHPGDYVKKGDKLFKIEDSKYTAILNKDIANKQKNEASLKLAINSYKRYKPLFKKGLTAKRKLDQLISKKEELEALIKANESTIKLAKLNLDYTEVKATIDGVIGRSLVGIGNIVGTTNKNSKLAVIIKSNPLYVTFAPSGDDVALIKRYKSEPKPKVEVTISSKSKIDLDTFKGHIDFIGNKTNESTGTVDMRAIIDNPNNNLLPGTFVNIKLFVTDQIPVIVLSPKNIMENELGSYVYIVNNKNKLQIRQVDITYETKEMMFISEKSLKIGDKVVVSPIKKLHKGMDVITTDVINPVLKQGK